MAKSVLQIRAIHRGAHHGQDDYTLEAIPLYRSRTASAAEHVA